MRRSTGERRRSSRIPPTRRNPSYAPSRPTHRGSATYGFGSHPCLPKLVDPRGGAPRGRLGFANGLFNLRDTTWQTPYRVPRCHETSGFLASCVRCPHRMAASAATSRSSGVESRGVEPGRRTQSRVVRPTFRLSVSVQVGRRSGGLRSTICGQTFDISRLSWMYSR